MKRLILAIAICVGFGSAAHAAETVEVCGQEFAMDTNFVVCEAPAGAALKNIGRLTQVGSLILEDPHEDLDLSPLGELANLGAMIVSPSLSAPPFDIGRLGSLRALIHLEVNRNADLRNIGVLKHLEYLSVVLDRPTSLAPLASLERLHELQVLGMRVELSDVGSLPRGLRELSLFGVTFPKETCLDKHTSLVALRSHVPIDMDCLRRLPKLKGFALALDDLASLTSGFRQLQWMDIRTKAVDLEPLGSFKDIKTLTLYAPQATDFAPIAMLTGLESLVLEGCRRLQGISWISHLTSLRILGLEGSSVSDISAIAALKLLERVFISKTKVTNIQALTSLPKLWQVEMRGIKLVSLAPLYGAKNLTFVDLKDAAFPPDELLHLKSLRPELHEQRGGAVMGFR